MLSDEQLAPDPALVAAGWQRRFVTDMTRTLEVVSLYRELGFEVRLEPVPQEQFGKDCDACQLVSLLRFRTVYTRRDG
jgi:hypothetical protein